MTAMEKQLMWASVLAGIVVALMMARGAYAERGYFAIGGEYMAGLMFPLFTFWFLFAKRQR